MHICHNAVAQRHAYAVHIISALLYTLLYHTMTSSCLPTLHSMYSNMAKRAQLGAAGSE